VTALCVEQSEEWLAGRVYLDMRKLEAAGNDQVPHAAVVDEEVKKRSLTCGGTKVQGLWG
jgi:hypothetical protein